MSTLFVHAIVTVWPPLKFVELTVWPPLKFVENKPRVRATLTLVASTNYSDVSTIVRCFTMNCC
jgi:hypothetical protein